MAANVADKLIKDGKVSRARSASSSEPLTPALAKQLGLDPKTKGVLVDEVVPGSPADKAGLKAGDVITAFDGKPVLSVPSFRLNVAASDVGKSFELTYFRDGKEQTTTDHPGPRRAGGLRAGEGGGGDAREAAKAEPAKAEIKRLRPRGPAADPRAGRASSACAKDAKGLLVSSVKEGSPAEAAGLEAGMRHHQGRPGPQAPAGPGRSRSSRSWSASRTSSPSTSSRRRGRGS